LKVAAQASEIFARPGPHRWESLSKEARTPGRVGMRTPRMSSSRARPVWEGAGKKSSMGIVRRDSIETTSRIASAAKSAGTVSARGEAEATFPPRVPRLRTWGLPIEAEARGRAGAHLRITGDAAISAWVMADPTKR
jgi:hypothetical protein